VASAKRLVATLELIPWPGLFPAVRVGSVGPLKIGRRLRVPSWPKRSMDSA